jgi:hypothetical protein
VDQLIQRLQRLKGKEVLEDSDRDLIEYVIKDLESIDELFQRDRDFAKKYLKAKYPKPESDEWQRRAETWNNHFWDSMCDLMWIDMVDISELCTNINEPKFFNFCAQNYVESVKSYLHKTRPLSPYYRSEQESVQLWEDYIGSTLDDNLKSNSQLQFYTYLR